MQGQCENLINFQTSLIHVLNDKSIDHMKLNSLSHENVNRSYLWTSSNNVTCHNDVASGSEITPCNTIDKPLVVYRFSGNFYDDFIMPFSDD